MYPIPSFVLLCALLSPSNSQFGGNPSMVVKSTTLTRSTPSKQGATVSIESTFEVSGNTEWNIVANRDDTWHLLLDLDNTWGFHPYKPSAITIEIDSDTIPDNAGIFKTFDDIFLGFTVNNDNNDNPQNNEFTAVRLVMDKDGKNLITPGCDYTAPYDTYSLKTGDLSTILNGANYRFCPLHLQNTLNCGGPNEYMRDSNGNSNINMINNFPIRFTLENHPNDYVTLTYQNTQICGFRKGFDTDQGLQIYFAIKDNGMRADIKSFYVEYAYDNSPTPSPTYSPTDNTPSPTQYTSNPTVPTSTPSDNPSRSPTNPPSVYPTKQPTKRPTYIPSNYPTTAPSEKPTSFPSIHPSVYPTHNPSVYPTKQPTYNPSIYPTTAPSESPTYDPSDYPTPSPSKNPSVLDSFTKPPSMDRSSAEITSKPTTTPIIISNYSSSNEVGIKYVMLFVMIILICFCFCCLYCLCIWYKKEGHKMNDSAHKPNPNKIRINISAANNPKLKNRVVSNSIYSVMSREKQASSNKQYGDEAEVDRQHTNGQVYNEDNTNNSYEGNIPTVRIKNEDKQNIGLSMIELWLETKVRLPQYYSFFAENGYDTLDIIKEITDESELIDIGIDIQQHIQQIMREIRKLQIFPSDDGKVTPISDENKMDEYDMDEEIMQDITLGDDEDDKDYITHRGTLGMGEEDIEHIKAGEM